MKSSIFAEIEKLKKNEIPIDEIQKAKNIIERDTYYSRESVSNIAGEIGYTVTLTNSTEYYKNYLDNINKVTEKDIKHVIKTYLNPDSAVISIVLPSKDGKPQAERKQAKDYSAKVISQNGNTTKYELENGAVLIITKNNSNDIIAMQMSSKGGNNLEKIPGTGMITAETMLKGTKKYKSQELSQLLEENGIRLIPQASGDSFSLSMQYTKNERDLALELFEEVANNAVLDIFDIEKAKSDRMYSVKNIKNTPDSLAFDDFKTVMWQDTPYGNTGKVLEKTIPSIQKEDVEEFYANLFPPQNVIITINGNVDEQTYINYFSEILANNGQAKINITQYKDRYKPINSNKVTKTIKDSQAAWLVIGWPTDGNTNQKDWATLQVIDSILGSGMSSRMFTNLRDNQSLAYQVGSSFSSHTNKGVFAVYIATNPENVKVAKKGMLDEIEKLKTEFVTDKELAEAKDKLIGNFVLSMETNMDKASTINALELTNRDYTFIDQYPNIINAVTLQDVIKTANKYFSKPYVFSVVGPEKYVDKL